MAGCRGKGAVSDVTLRSSYAGSPVCHIRQIGCLADAALTVHATTAYGDITARSLCGAPS
ncbi:hypothetical protein AB0J28_27735 [Streptosporangium canum]|uniref:hypothetical protein n=1 Tax=Streptosporangium canum TaxID=324952 RepID=UPI003440B0EA